MRSERRNEERVVNQAEFCIGVEIGLKGLADTINPTFDGVLVAFSLSITQGYLQAKTQSKLALQWVNDRLKKSK